MNPTYLHSKLLFELSVIIPVLNDSEALNNLATSLNTQKNINFEVIVINGGNPNATESSISKIICEKNGFRYFTSKSGRGRQMNLGRTHSKSSHLLFLHADSVCTSDFQLREAVDAIKTNEEKIPWVAGHFGLRFQAHNPQTEDLPLNFMLGFLERKSKLNRKNSTNGDQGLLISREFFDHVEGFSEHLPFLEDQIIVEEIRKKGEMFTLPNLLQTSARRFEEEGFVRRYYLMMIIMGAYHTQTRELFELAPPLYVNQDEAGKLDMRPFFDTLERLHQTIGPRRSIKLWREVGAFAGENVWQAFLFADYLLDNETDQNPFLNFYDARFGSVESKAFDNVMGFIAYFTVTKSAPMVYKSLRLFRSLRWIAPGKH